MAARDYLKNWQHVQTCWHSIAMTRASQHILRGRFTTEITLYRDRTIWEEVTIILVQGWRKKEETLPMKPPSAKSIKSINTKMNSTTRFILVSASWRVCLFYANITTARLYEVTIGENLNPRKKTHPRLGNNLIEKNLNR